MFHCNPNVSFNWQATFIFWTAWPEAPLIRLSRAEIIIILLFFLALILLFFVSLTFCSEDEKYTFQYTFDYPEDGTEYIERWQPETEWSFDVPGIGYVKYASSYISLSQYLGQDDGFYKFKSTVIDMEIDNSVDNINLKKTI